jgi:ABC-type Zn uptake system ZnuABC Zn-binding protein ZnuA
MKRIINTMISALLLFTSIVIAAEKINVVTTLSTYADITKKIGRES